MTAMNDGLPLAESTALEPDETVLEPLPVTGDAEQSLDPPTELLPLDGATATKVAADDAANKRAELEAAAAPTTMIPNTTTQGSMEGDLFDGTPTQ
jgi:hypothetical protein